MNFFLFFFSLRQNRQIKIKMSFHFHMIMLNEENLNANQKGCVAAQMNLTGITNGTCMCMMSPQEIDPASVDLCF